MKKNNFIPRNGKKIRLCMLTSIFPRFKDDTRGNFIYNNAASLAESGIEVHTIAPGTEGAKDFEIIGGVRVYRFRYWLFRKNQKVAYREGIPENLRKSKLAKIQFPFFLSFFIIKCLFVSKKCDVIHAQWIQSALPGIIAKFIFKIPLIISIRGTDIRMVQNSSFMRKLNTFLLDNADIIISLASKESKLAMKLGNYDIIEMHNPLDGNKFNPDIPFDKIKTEFAIENKRIVTFIGRLSHEKDPLTFIEAIPIVLRRVKDVAFFVVGYGPLTEEIETMVRVSNLDRHIFITGNRNDTNMFHSASDVFVSLGIYENLWSNSLIEALASGCGCIVTDAGDTSDYLTHMENVYLIPTQNPEALARAIMELLNNRDLRKHLSKNGIKYIKENGFFKNAVVERLIGIYNQTLTS